MFKTLSKWKEK